MVDRRVVVSGVGAAIVALLLSACGSSPLLPPALGLTSPYQGSSVLDPLSPTGAQVAKVRVCSLAGGPLAVDVHSPAPDSNTGLSVHANSTDLETTGDVEAARLIEFVQIQAIGADTHLESERAMRPGECANVLIASAQYFDFVGKPFTFTITW
ncbi:hypothetical protein [Dermatobacter hominis]|uniref:hypothetical protein n=1 Tax=Dermatobacter hominis TaxID=2884263 RepID=UPI001D105B33|nr:hypothetical protein [Dermatobacter hominis]UDY36307.1 hypothetical protein LH044_01940 [Dermatobacter hominis]